MKGRFKGWVPGKSFGFVETDDGGRDVFIHAAAVSEPKRLSPGSILEFEVEETDKGRSAINVHLIMVVTAAKRERHPNFPKARIGRIRLWMDKGFGFLETNDGGDDVFVHASSLPREEKGYLSEGDVVQFETKQGERGLEAYDVRIVGWEPTGNPLADFADLGPSTWLAVLEDLAEDEEWNYGHIKSAQTFPILRSYIRYTFHRLTEMANGLSYSKDGLAASFNTGLVTPNQEEIYGIFRRNQRQGRQPWSLQSFYKGSERIFINAFGANPPPLAEYFENPADLLFDRRFELYVSIDHVLKRLDRFPKHLQDNAYIARQLLLSAEAQTKKRVYRNYKTAIPQYFREGGGPGSLQLLLPICLENPAKADLASYCREK
jgi:cold shock CspA family protein